MAIDESLTMPAAILFDMDGTLTAPLLDFDQIKRDMGIGSAPILETLKRMPEDRRRTAQAILDDHENRAAVSSTLNAGCHELLNWLDTVGVKKALVTRNTRRSVKTVFSIHGLKIDVCVTREDGKYKPDPDPLLLACDRLNVPTGRAWMVGDGYHDIEAGLAAGVRTVWVSHGQARNFAAEPDHTVRNLLELTAWLGRLSDKTEGL